MTSWQRAVRRSRYACECG